MEPDGAELFGYEVAVTVSSPADVGLLILNLLPNGSMVADGDVISENGVTLAKEAMVDNMDATWIHSFGAWYQGVHGYVSSACCISGIVMNVMNIAVLTRKSMISPTNYLLTALAITDLLTMISYLPFALHFHCVSVPDRGVDHAYGWIVFILFNTCFTITTHTVACWLTVALAVFRYIAVCRHTTAHIWCNLRRARMTVVIIALSTLVVCIPNYIMWKPFEIRADAYWFHENVFVTSFHKTFNYWVYGVAIKVLPCILLVCLSGLLLQAMIDARKRRRALKARTSKSNSDKESHEHDRTTAMLVAVVLSFVAAELPHGILAFLSGLDDRIFTQVYVPLGDFWDILVLVNSTVNFLLYCTMSAQFRKTFREVFCFRCRSRCASGWTEDVQLLCGRRKVAEASATDGEPIVMNSALVADVATTDATNGKRHNHVIDTTYQSTTSLSPAFV